MNKKEKQQIKYLLENLKWYTEAPNEQDYNGEYEPPMEWEQREAKIFLKYLEEKDKEIERLNKEIGIRIQNSQNLVRKNDELEETIDKIEFEINNMKEIIRQQPSEDSDTDEWIINRLNGLLYIIKGSEKRG